MDFQKNNGFDSSAFGILYILFKYTKPIFIAFYLVWFIKLDSLICNQQVVGSIPIVGFSNTLRKVLFFYPSEIDGRAVGW